MVISASLIAQLVKNPPAIQETPVLFLGWEDLLEKGMAMQSSILPCRIPQRSLVGYSPWGHKESDTTEQLTLALSFLKMLMTAGEMHALYVEKNEN